MNKVKNYILASYDELMHKVSWPTWEELQESTMLVLVSSILFSAAVALTDFGLQKILNLFYSVFK
jgi:preprotein translocase subunit SecE